MTIQCHQLAHHSLYIRDPEASLEFYQQVLGMTLQKRLAIDEREYLFLRFNASMRERYPMLAKSPHCLLQLVFDPAREFNNRVEQGARAFGYWKIALSVADMKIAHGKLLTKGVPVNDPFQVPDVAYLCHCEDPDGYFIELIQHRFEQNHTDLAPDDRFALGTPTSFSLITCRVRDPQQSIAFYENHLGFRLVSKQTVAHRGFTLYFLSCDVDSPPCSDIEDVGIREWLWQRPYALLELQHVWGTENEPDGYYDSDQTSGFRSFGLLSETLATSIHGRTNHAVFNCPSMVIKDPDGYSVEVLKLDRN